MSSEYVPFQMRRGKLGLEARWYKDGSVYAVRGWDLVHFLEDASRGVMESLRSPDAGKASSASAERKARWDRAEAVAAAILPGMVDGGLTEVEQLMGCCNKWKEGDPQTEAYRRGLEGCGQFDRKPEKQPPNVAMSVETATASDEAMAKLVEGAARQDEKLGGILQGFGMGATPLDEVNENLGKVPVAEWLEVMGKVLGPNWGRRSGLEPMGIHPQMGRVAATAGEGDGPEGMLAMQEGPPVQENPFEVIGGLLDCPGQTTWKVTRSGPGGVSVETGDEGESFRECMARNGVSFGGEVGAAVVATVAEGEVGPVIPPTIACHFCGNAEPPDSLVSFLGGWLICKRCLGILGARFQRIIQEA